MARSRYKEAAKVAIILANNEQVKGNIFFQNLILKINFFLFNTKLLFNNIKISMFCSIILILFAIFGY